MDKPRCKPGLAYITVSNLYQGKVVEIVSMSGIHPCGLVHWNCRSAFSMKCGGKDLFEYVYPDAFLRNISNGPIEEETKQTEEA